MAARKRDRRGRFVRSDPDGPAPSPDETRARTAAASTSGEGASQGATKAMATPVKMPELGESITEGTITRWLKQEGDRVEADEPLFEVSTDKVDTEVPSPVAGILTSIKVKEDETVEVGAELAEIDQEGAGGGGEAEQPAASGADGGGGGGATTITLPELGESITEGTITRWLKQEGDRVEA